MRAKIFFTLWLSMALLLPFVSAMPAPIAIVAAENFYGELAKEIGGHHVTVQSILDYPNQDPHLFYASPKVARAIAQADLVVYNGIGYDAWIDPLLSIKRPRAVILVAQLAGKKNGNNPHIWYDPTIMLVYVKALANFLSRQDPIHAADYRDRLWRFQHHYQTLTARLERLRQLYQGTPVIATEPVFNYMAQYLGLRMQGCAFQQQVMNGIEPSPRQMLAFKAQLLQAKVLIYNKQVRSVLTQHVCNLAQKHQIPIIGVTETQPIGQTYWVWMDTQLRALKQGLDGRYHI